MTKKTTKELKAELKEKRDQHQRLKLKLQLNDMNRRVANLELLTLGADLLEDSVNEQQ